MKTKYAFKLREMVKDNAGVQCEVIARCRNIYGVNSYIVKYEHAKPMNRGLEGSVAAGQVWIESYLVKA